MEGSLTRVALAAVRGEGPDGLTCRIGRVQGVRLYLDEDAGENAVVRGLRARGVDVLATANSVLVAPWR